MNPLIQYEDRNMLIADPEKRLARKAVLRAHARLERLRLSKEQGFLDLPFDLKSVGAIERAAKRVQKKFSHLIVVGIGGSDLGAKTVWQALGGKSTFLTFVGNPDPETVSSLIESTDWSRTAINVISKSGTTLETMAVFMTLRQALIAAVGEKRHAEHVIVTTDPSISSALYQIATDEGYEVLPHPLNVGGRFSVLSVVGMFPTAVSGTNIRKILNGARQAELERREKKAEGVAARFATNQFLSMTEHGRNIHVLMPYADLLSSFGFWYRQLWAESLGKKRDGISIGPTPVAALGATDQHSQIQLYNEGPDDKTITFIEIDRFRRSIRVPAVWKDQDGIKYVGGLSFEEILHAERSGTERALTKNGRANGTLRIPRISPETIGALFMTFEAAAAYMAELLEVSAYDQPGVEEGKKETRKILS